MNPDQNYGPTIIGVEEIKKMIPHRDPFLLIDSVHEIIPGEKIIASRLLGNDPIFQGHFPGNPIYPGVYYIESIAQAGAILIFKSMAEHAEKTLGLLSGVEEARFRKPCKPGDRLKYEVSIEKKRGVFFWLKGRVYCGKDLACEAALSVAITKS